MGGGQEILNRLSDHCTPPFYDGVSSSILTSFPRSRSRWKSCVRNWVPVPEWHCLLFILSREIMVVAVNAIKGRNIGWKRYLISGRYLKFWKRRRAEGRVWAVSWSIWRFNSLVYFHFHLERMTQTWVFQTSSLPTLVIHWLNWAFDPSSLDHCKDCKLQKKPKAFSSAILIFARFWIKPEVDASMR